MAVDMFLKLGDLKGESQDATHKETIDVLSWSWGLSQSGSMHAGAGGGAGKVNVQDLNFTKWIDKASPVLALSCCNGKHFPEATLTIRKAGEKPLEYLIVKLTSVLVSSVSTGGSGGEDRLSENVTLNFAKFHVTYQPQKKDGTKDGGPITMAWDVAANKAIG